MIADRRIIAWFAPLALVLGAAAGPSDPPKAPGGTTVVITQPDEANFPEISVYFEVRKPDGNYLLDARREDFRVSEDGEDRPILAFEAPESVEKRPTTLVLVLDRSRSMVLEDRIGGLKRAVASFLEGLPRGSRVAVVAFGSDLQIQPFTDDRAKVLATVNALQADGGTRYFDAVAVALELLAPETGRRAILAMTDGEDTISRSASLESVIKDSRRLGLPIHTLGLGTGREVATGALARLAADTRGQAYNASNADELRAIYEEIARRLGFAYRLAFHSDRPPDGTLRPIRVSHRRSTSAGESAVFIRGMVAPSPGWPGLFLLLIGGLGLIAILPGRLAARSGRG